MTTLTGYPALAQEILAIRENRRREEDADAIVAKFLKSKGIITIEPKAALPPKGVYKKAYVKFPENDGDGAPRNYRGMGWKALMEQETTALQLFLGRFTKLIEEEARLEESLMTRPSADLRKRLYEVKADQEKLIHAEQDRWDTTDQRLREATSGRHKRTNNPIETSTAAFARELRGALMVRSGR